MRILARRSVAASVALLAMAMAPANAQLASDDVPRERTIPRTEQIRRQLKDSRYHLGPFRVQPVFGLRDFGYDNNVFGSENDQVADWRSTVSAGARLILPVGPKMYLRGKLVPEYTWYQKLADRRVFGGDYSASALGLFNHLSLEAGGDVFKGVSPVTSEIERSALGTRASGFAKGEVDLIGRVSLFAQGESQRQRYEVKAADAQIGLEQLERTDAVVRSGIRYRFASYLDFSAAVERTTSTFLTGTERDNHSDAVILGVHYDRPRTFVNLAVGSRKGEAKAATSIFPHYKTTTGSYYASHEFARRALVDAFGHRGVVYGLFLDNPYYFEARNGAGLTIPIGQRLAVRGFGELGKNGYPVTVLVSGVPTKRNDDVTVTGGGMAFRTYRKIVLAILATSYRYSSNIPNFDRSIFRLTTTVSFGGDFF